MKKLHFNFEAEDLLCGALLAIGLLGLVFIWALVLMITEGGAV